MNNHQKGCYRDRLVLDTIQEWGTMDTEMIRLLFYPSSRVAQRRLAKMTLKGKVKRSRDTVELPYAYFVQRFDGARLALNWVRMLLLQRLKSWEVLETFDYATGTVAIRNTVTDTVKTVNVFYNLTKKAWSSGDVIAVYETEKERREATKVVKGELWTIDKIKEGLTC